MSFLLWQGQGAAGIASARQVLRAHEVPLFETAASLAQRLDELVQGEGARQQAQAEAARQTALAQGLAQGQQQAREVLANELARMARQAELERERHRSEVAALALEVTRKLIGQVPEEARLTGLAEQAARELLPARTLRLHVHPSRLDTLRNHLARLDPQERSGLGRAEVCGDATLAADSCRLETDLGSADASVGAQLARLAAAWGVEWAA